MNRNLGLWGMQAGHLRKWLREATREDDPYETHCVANMVKVRSTKNKYSPTWRQEDKESNPEWRQKSTGQDTA